MLSDAVEDAISDAVEDVTELASEADAELELDDSDVELTMLVGRADEIDDDIVEEAPTSVEFMVNDAEASVPFITVVDVGEAEAESVVEALAVGIMVEFEVAEADS